MKAAKVDANQQAIVAALRQIGACVEPIHMVGRGVPDLLVGFRGKTFLLEIKTQKGKLTEPQTRWFGQWCGQAAIVRNVGEAFDAIGAEVG